MADRDTIVALASGPLPAGVAVVRVSGPRALVLAEGVAGPGLARARLSLRSIVDPVNGRVIDRGLVTVFPGPRSFTGEDVAEFHVHGSRAVVAALLSVLTGEPEVRIAEPGEFTRRAFLEGRLDLTAAEGLADLIDAETEAERRRALEVASGGLAARAAAWRERLVEIRALVEAELDFSDEGDVDVGVGRGALSAVGDLSSEIGALLAEAGRVERLSEGFRIAVVGRPNVGKSSLVNRLAREEVAIVTEHAGTTRDVLSVRLDLGGYPVTVMDTAGARETSDPVERIGVERAWNAARRADLVLWLEDGAPADEPEAGSAAAGGPWGPGPEGDGQVLRVRTKGDLHGGEVHGVHGGDGGGLEGRSGIGAMEPFHHTISALTGEGMDGLVAALADAARQALAPCETVPVTRLRQVRELEAVSAALERLVAGGADLPLELVAEELRLASHHLGRLTGAVGVEEVLDAVFSRFCLGK